MLEKKLQSPYFTWGCADDLTFRLKKTLYCSDDNDCYDVSSVALTDVAVSSLLEISTCPKRRLTQRYASSINRQLPISPCALLVGLLYSQRLHQVNPAYLGRVSSADLYVISMLIATKFLHDEGEEEEIFNEEWAEAAGLAVSTVNKLEKEFLDAIDWQIFVNPNDFLSFCEETETKIALKYGLARGWFSYTDLTQVLVATQYQKILKGIIESTVKIIGGCALIYGMSLSLLATTLICYSAPQHTTQNVSTNTTTITTCSLQESYDQRRFSRKRKVRISRNNNKNLADNADDDDDETIDQSTPLDHQIELQSLLSDSRADLTTLSSNRKNLQNCSCQSVYFESKFHHLLHQTKLFQSIDPLHSQYFCNNKLFNLDPGKNCNCSNKVDMNKGFIETPRPHTFMYFDNKYHSRHIFSNPTLLGMVIM